MKFFGKTFLSTLFLLSFYWMQAQEMGLAGYYSDEFQGRKTASGEPYDKSDLTAAHKTLEFGTYVRITRLDNKKSVVVRINDRGPYIKDRVVDMSRKAAEALDLIRDGRAQVKLEVVSKSELTAAPESPASEKKEELTAKSGEPVATAPVKAEPEKKPEPETPKTVQPVKTEKTPKTAETTTKGKAVTSQTYKDFGLYKIQVLKPKEGGYGVQVASLTEYENVLKQVAELQENHFKNILVSVEKGKDEKPVYKIILGPFPDLPTATSYKENLKKKHKMDGFSVNLEDIKYE